MQQTRFFAKIIFCIYYFSKSKHGYVTTECVKWGFKEDHPFFAVAAYWGPPPTTLVCLALHVWDLYHKPNFLYINR
jgi:hypothetical protein